MELVCTRKNTPQRVSEKGLNAYIFGVDCDEAKARRQDYLFSSQCRKWLAFSLATSNFSGAGTVSCTNNLRAK